MNSFTHQTMVKGLRLGLSALGGLFMLTAVLLIVSSNSLVACADPIPPEEGGYPKLSLSVKAVTPTLAHTGGVTLYYAIEIRNTGAYTAGSATLTDVIPEGTTYNGDAQASVAPPPSFDTGTKTVMWGGDVGFDSTVVVSFSVSVSPTLSGIVRNTAVISHPLIARPVTVTAETVVTDQSILAIAKTAMPSKPGANKPLTYTIVVTNQGQPATDLLITVTDQVPDKTTSPNPGVDGITDGNIVTWTRHITLELGETTVFTFSVDVGNVPSGTVITNDNYRVTSPETGVTAGEPYTVTAVDSIFLLSKHVWPDPPGSNREMTYTLTLINVGSLATNLVVTDRVPTGVMYQRGGSLAGGMVSWLLPSLDTGESAQFTYTVSIGDVMDVPIVNDKYGVCCDEGICQAGYVLTSVVQGPTFETSIALDPIAKKPGAGTGPVTPTLVVHNLGPGSALDAMALLQFRNINVSLKDLIARPATGTFSKGPDCGDDCFPYVWVGSLGAGKAITFTTDEGQNTIGGDPGTTYTATVVITDSLSNMNTAPVTGTAVGLVTHYASLIPTKSAPPVIGRGQLMTYTITVRNSALATDEPPSPVLTDVVPMSTTLMHVGDGGGSHTLTDSTVVSWTLPAMSPGDVLSRSFTVLVDDDLVSGTQIINDDYRITWRETETSTVFANIGQPVTTTVQEVGLIDSYKEVTPTMALPGPGNILTYYVHIVNSSPLPLTGVTVYDLSPWEFSTYQRDAVASAGQVISDIVNVRWEGNVGPLSSEVVTFTVLVDPDYQGSITNTAVISHPGLLSEVVVQAVAYITERPVLRITKSASPDPVEKGAELAYTIRVANLGQQASSLVITDAVPANTDYVTGGKLEGDQVKWETSVLEPGESRTFAFQVTVGSGPEVVNDRYAVRCAEGVVAVGAPVVTQITRGGGIYLPLILRNAP
jgi:uncharacterized repeat protein (TIGR01451 family)